MKVLLTFLVLTGFFCSAASPFFVAVGDTIGKEASNPATQKAFLEQFGRDDSSKALIKYFFYKRGYGRSMTLTGAVLSALSPIGVAVGINNTGFNTDSTGKTEYGYVYLAFIAVIVGCGGLAILILGLTQLGRYSRKRLLKILNKYFTGYAVPKGISNKRVFRGFVQYGEWNEEINLKIKLADRKKSRERHKLAIEKRKQLKLIL